MKEIRWLLEEKYGGKRTEAAEKDIARLARGEHVDYVIGWVEFLGCKIDLSQRPLIPRSETEYWTEKAIREMQTVASRAMQFSSRLTPLSEWTLASRKIASSSRQIRILDIFAGSGCIGIAVLKHIPWAQVDFAEKEEKFLKQIEVNAKLNGVAPSRYRLIQSDIFSSLGETRPHFVRHHDPRPARISFRRVSPRNFYDYILANPPYVAESKRKHVQKSVLEQEPLSAVFGGKDGLFYIRKFLREVKNYLVPGGVVYLEFDSPQKTEVIKLAKAAGAKEVKAFKDQFGKWRYARIVFEVVHN
ncbi:MAG: methyltransferase [Candidatus Wildermuthbacteria bacterium]|nr:methyltransferase [Candidatus Wildermuthbacteria bacterium]